MNHEHEFDELARRKLAERDFPFQEAHWLDAQRAIAAQGKGRRGGALWMVGGAAAVIIAAWLLWPASEVPVMAEVNGTGTERPVEADVTGNAMEVTPAYGTAVTVTDAEVENTTIDGTVSDEQPQQRTVRDRIATTADDRAVPNTSVVDDRLAHASNDEQPAPQLANANVADPVTPQPGNDVTGDVKVDPFPPGPDPTTPDPLAVLLPSNPANSSANLTDPLLGSPTPDPQTDVADASVTRPATSTDPGSTVDGSTVPVLMIDPVPTTKPATTDTADLVPGINLTSSTPDRVDTTVVAIAQSNDSTIVPPDPAPIAPPLITPRSPWELAAFFGAFNTTSIYAGGNSAAWAVSPERTYGGGVELMHMGRNFGLGVGAHYGTYADRLRTPEESRSVLSTETSWYFEPVDTTIMIVLGYDSTTNSWLTQNIDVTINELRMALDSSYASVLIREARERINRTSYVEAVGLADAHLVQGRLSFGIRGGPTFGLLTTHRGSIPGTGEADIAFEDIAMRSFVVGWTARAYVRYRFNAAWSVGFEPAARGQLWESFDHEGVTRRSSALGVMLSLSYRLP